MRCCQVHIFREHTHLLLWSSAWPRHAPKVRVKLSLPLLSLSSHFAVKQLTQAKAAMASTSPAPPLGLRISASPRAGDRILRGFQETGTRGLKEDGRQKSLDQGEAWPEGCTSLQGFQASEAQPSPQGSCFTDNPSVATSPFETP